MPRIYRHKANVGEKTFPCWRVQYYDPLTLCWRIIPKDYTSIKLAEIVAKRLPVPKVRLMQINSEKDQILLPEVRNEIFY